MITAKLVNKILSQYFDQASNVQKMSMGNANYNASFYASGEKYLLRIYLPNEESSRSEDEILKEFEVIRTFSAHNIPTRQVVEKKSSDTLTKVEDYFAAVFEFIEGENVYGKLKAIHIEEIGEIMAKMHKIAKRKNLICDRGYKNGYWNYVLNKTKKEDLEQKEGNTVQRVNESIGLLEKVDQYLIHGDFHFANILFQNDKLKALLDFDDYRMGHFADDLARFFVADLAYTEKYYYFHTQKFITSFFDGYRKYMEFTNVDTQLIFTYIDLHYLNQLLRLKKDQKDKVGEFRTQVSKLKEFISFYIDTFK